MNGQSPIILFDGACHLCNGFVVFVIQRDVKFRFHFSPLQSDIEADSIVLVEGGRRQIESAAVLDIVKHLSWPWPLFYVFILVPRPIRDAVYRWIARNRYRWFGKSEHCMVPKPEWQERFL